MYVIVALSIKFHGIFSPHRRYTQDNNSLYYTHEKIYGHHGPTPELPGWDNNDGDHGIPVHLFAKHVSELHLDQVNWLNFVMVGVV